MDIQPEILLPNRSISDHVYRILVYENRQHDVKTALPFFADGYPGIMFQSTESGLFVSPQNKQLPVFFLYGQTIHPITLSMEGPFKLIGFQLYPDSVGQLLEIQAKEINDGCFDLSTLKHYDANPVIQKIQKQENTDLQISLISDFLSSLSKLKPGAGGDHIRQAIHMILKSNGSVSISKIRSALFLTERTFERRFLKQVGIGPKQFAKIIQFQNALSEMTDLDLDKLTDVVYNNGFADQSHFIKTFKEFTGKTPRQFLNP